MLEFSLEDVYMFLYIYFFAPLFLLNGCGGEGGNHDDVELEKNDQKSRNTTNLTNITITNTNKNSQPYTNFYTIVDSSCTFHVGAFASDKNITRFSIDISENVIFSNDIFYKCIKLQNVSIGDSATSIGDYAFYKCSSLTNVTIGESVESIGDRAFQGCTSLTMSIPGSVTIPDTVTIPNSVTSIGHRAFQGCYSLTDVTIPDSVLTIGFRAFFECTSLTDVTISKSVNSISILQETFAYCSKLVNLSIPESVKNIGDYAFLKCESLTDVTIPDSVTSIGDGVFYECYNLKTITIGKSVESIGKGVFSGCSKLTTVTIPESVTSINNEAFSSSSIENIYFTEDVIALGTFGLKTVNIGKKIMFRGRKMFLRKSESSKNVSTGTTKEITIEDSSGVLTKDIISNSVLATNKDTNYKVTINNYSSIGNSAFHLYRNLVEASIGESIESIGASAFSYCIGLTTVTIGNTVKTIGDNAFQGCSGLTTVTIGDSVTSIGANAFQGCKSLSSINQDTNGKNTLPDKVTSIGERAFQDCSGLTNLLIPDSVKSIGANAFQGCKSLSSINQDTNGKNTLPDIVTIISTGTFSGCSSLKNMLIRDSVTSIGDNAFYDCSGLTTVTIGASVTSIGANAFQGCSGLTNLLIPDSVTKISANAFQGCKSLSSINQFFGINTLPDKVTIISTGVFQHCSGLTNFLIHDFIESIGDNAFQNCSGLTTVTLGTNVKTIGSKAFYNCSDLSSINQVDGINTLPDKVTRIGDNAFQNCSKLTNLLIHDSVESIGKEAFKKSGITDIHVTKYAFNNGKLDLNTLDEIDEKVQFRGNSMKINVLPYFKITTIDASNSRITFQNGGPLTKTDVSNSRLTTNTNIKYVYIEHHTSIGNKAFWDCSHIEKITIPSTLHDISENAFNNAFNEGLLDVKIAVVSNKYFNRYRIENGALYKNTTKRIGSRLIKLPIESYHSNIKQLKSYNIPEYTHSIADYAFYNCKSINTITVPPLVRSIGTDAFKTNTDLSKNVTINMSNFTLYYLNKYYDLSMSPDFSYNSIETSYTANNFFGATNASLNITLDTEFLINPPNSSNNILESIDVSGNKKNVVVSNYQSIAADCFENNNNMEYIALENSIDYSLNTIGSGAFANCSNLQQVLYADEEHIELYNKNKDQEYKIQSAYNTINDLSGDIDVSGIFQNCVSLGRFNIPKNVATIPHYAFKDCYYLVVVQMAENTKTIHNEAFENCYLLRFLQLLSVTNLGENIASTAFITDVTIPNELDNLTNVDMEAVLTNLSISNIKTIKLTQNSLSNANQQSN
jgi:hypothetical protein